MEVPAFLLRRLYVKGSLRNVDGGCEFDLSNTLGSGYAERALPLLIDDDEVPLADTRFVVAGEATPFADVSPERPMTLGMNQTVTVAINGRTVAPGKHKISIGFVVVGMGEMRFDVTDALEGAEDGDDAA
jgi:hypothetical protein